MNKKSTKDILQAPRGMRDFFGEEFKKRKNFYKIAEEISERYGFSGIETPIMEHTEIFQKGVGEGTDIVDKEMYNLTTTGGDKLTLRPEGTAAIMRAYIEHGMGSLQGAQMLYYSGPFFRHERPQKGRYRQFYQFGLEVMGSKEARYDAIIIKTGYEILKSTDKEIIVEINTLGNNEERKKYVDILRNFYMKNIDSIGESDKSRVETNPLRILDSKDKNTKSVNENAPSILNYLGDDSIKHFNIVKKILEENNIKYEVIPSLVRGLDYYEHTVFEYITINSDGNKSDALGGGGRYDGLAETLGHNKSVPSVGLGLGVDRIIDITDINIDEKSNIIPILKLTNSTNLDIYIKKIIKELNNIKKVIIINHIQKFDKQIKFIKKNGYRYFIIIDEKIIKENKIILRSLKDDINEQININELKNRIREIYKKL